MIKKDTKLCLLWQNKENRQWYHIGNLLYNEENELFSFEYEREKKRRGLAEALKNGYQPHIAFPDLDKTYISNKLFLPFARRIPNINRPDYENILVKYGLSKNSSIMEILQVTGGRLATDNYEFVKPIHLIDESNTFTIDFYVRGWRYYNGESLMESNNWILSPEDIEFQIDTKNPNDDCAVEILIHNNRIGYIPAFYSAFFKELLEKNQNFEVYSYDFDKESMPQLRLLIYIKGLITNGITRNEIQKNLLLPV